MTDEDQITLHVSLPLPHHFVAIFLLSQQRSVTEQRHDPYIGVNEKKYQLITDLPLLDDGDTL